MNHRLGVLPIECYLSPFKGALILVTIITVSVLVLLFNLPLPTSLSASASPSSPESMLDQVSNSTLYNAPVHFLNNSQDHGSPKVSESKPSGPIITDPTSPHTQKVTITGTVTSKDDPIRGTGLEQSYYLFSVDNTIKKTYSGVITFTSSKPVQLQSINILTLNNTLKLPIKYGTLYTFPLNNTIIITSNLFDEPKVTGTVSFSGNSLRFIANEPFLLTYSFSGEQLQSVVKNDIESGLETYRELIGTRS